jgi:hypothetical protein
MRTPFAEALAAVEDVGYPANLEKVAFLFTYASSDPETAAKERDSMTAFEQQPIWQSLGAVKAGQAFRVPAYCWRSQTYLLANKVIDDLFTHLTDASATTPVLDGPESSLSYHPPDCAVL